MTERTYGIRMTADASGVVGASRESAKATGEFGDRLDALAGISKKSAEETARFVANLKEQAATIGMSRRELEAYRASQLNLNAAQKQVVETSLRMIETHERMSAVGAAVGKTLVGWVTSYAVGLAAATRASVNHAADVQRIAERYTKTAEEISVMKYQAELLDTSLSSVTQGMDKLAKAQLQAGAGRGGQARDALAILGIDSRGKDPKTLLYEIADGFKSIEDAETRAALATMLFGQRGGELVNYLSAGSVELRRLEEAGRRWAEISGTDAQEAKRLKDDLVTLNYASQELARSISSTLVPALSAMIERFLEARRSGSGLFGSIGAAVQGAWWGDDRQTARHDLVTGTARLLDIDKMLELQKGDFALMQERRAVMARIASARALLNVTEPGFFNAGGGKKGPSPEGAAAQVFASRFRTREAEEQELRAQLEQHAPNLTSEQYASVEAAISERFRKRERKPGDQGEGLLIELQNKLSSAKGEASEFDAVMRRLTEGTKKYSPEVQAAALALAGEIDETKRAREEGERMSAARLRAAREYEQTAHALDREIRQQEETNHKLEEHNQAIGMTEEQLGRLKIARAEDAVAAARQALAIDALRDSEDAYSQFLRERLRLSEQGLRLAREGAVLEAAATAAKKEADEFKRNSETIERSLTDALMRGFEGGKDAGRNFWQAMKNMARTVVLRPLIQPMVEPLGQVGAGLAKGAGGLIGDLLRGLGIGGGGFTPTTLGDAGLGAFYGVYHRGGVIGADAAPMRAAHALAFAGARRMHTGGISGDEEAIIAKRGEGVFTPAQMRRLAPVEATAPVVTYSPTITIDARGADSGVEQRLRESFGAMLYEHRRQIAGLVDEAGKARGRRVFA